MADDLTERVARAIWHNVHDTPWDEAMPELANLRREDARTALAVVADDVDGIAGVLRAHETNTDEYGTALDCVCGWAHGEYGPEDHQAAMVAAHIRGGA